MKPPRQKRAIGRVGAAALLAMGLGCERNELPTGPENTPQRGPTVAMVHGSFPTSTGIYRLPYFGGLTIDITRDHHDHTPVNRIDMAGDLANFPIVAAASGRIRAIVDRHGGSNGFGDGLSADGTAPHVDALEHSCQDDATVVGNCSDYNNYVWIEHPNGEWSKYTHFATRSVTNQGWSPGDWIEAGEVLGIEADIGIASGRHLHHELGLPDDPDEAQPFTSLGGFMVPDFGINLVPIVCGIPGGLYQTGGRYVAGPCQHATPVADAGGPYQVAEGSTVVLDGSGSADPEARPLTYLWAPDTNLDDASLEAPTFAAVDDGVTDVTLTVYDQVEALSDSDATTVTVTNVDPTVTIDANTSTAIDEGQTLRVQADFTDPGVLDAPFVASVECLDITGHSLTVAGTVNVISTAGGVSGTVQADCPYGDTSRSGTPPTGTFEVTVRVTDKDGGEGSVSFDLTVRNVTPSLSIGSAGSTVVNGMNTFITQIGQPIDLAANVVDPGSDDLRLTWDWDDGSVDHASYRLNPVLPDPFPSPTSDPRDVTDLRSHAWSGACFYSISVTAVDDDGGMDQAGASVIIAGDSRRARGVGYWLTQYRRNRSALDPATLACYLTISGYMSTVFDEARLGTGSSAEATDVLLVAGDGGDMTHLLDQQLLGVWLNFANGAFAWDELVDTTGDGTPDTELSVALARAETVRLAVGSTREALEAQMRALEAINLMHGG